VKVVATAQSSTSTSVTWSYSLGDAIPESVTVNERTQNGALIAAQSELLPDGTALFTGLIANTAYWYEWCGKFSTAGRVDNFSCHEPVAGKTSPLNGAGDGPRGVSPKG